MRAVARCSDPRLAPATRSPLAGLRVREACGGSTRTPGDCACRPWHRDRARVRGWRTSRCTGRPAWRASSRQHRPGLRSHTRQRPRLPADAQRLETSEATDVQGRCDADLQCWGRPEVVARADPRPRTTVQTCRLGLGLGQERGQLPASPRTADGEGAVGHGNGPGNCRAAGVAPLTTVPREQRREGSQGSAAASASPARAHASRAGQSSAWHRATRSSKRLGLGNPDAQLGHALDSGQQQRTPCVAPVVRVEDAQGQRRVRVGPCLAAASPSAMRANQGIPSVSARSASASASTRGVKVRMPATS